MTNELDEMLQEAQDDAEKKESEKKALLDAIKGEDHVNLWEHGWVRIARRGRGDDKSVMFYVVGPDNQKQQYEIPPGVESMTLFNFLNKFYKAHSTRVK